MIKYDVLNRFTLKVQFTAEIECKSTASVSFKNGLALKWAYLEGAYLKGANLEGADLEGAYLKGADLKGADLEGANLKGANLEGADLKGAYLKGAYLEGADLEGADLEGANLEGAYLEGADLKVPKIENIHQKVYEAAKCENALDMGSWHKCETTHCRAGWVVHLAGKEGYKLEKKVGTAVAAGLIYRESDPKIKAFPDFYCDNDTALKDMKRLAGVE